MAKRNQSGIELVASMPWPAGIALGFIAYLAVRYGISWYFTASHNPYLSGLGEASAKGIYTPIGWMLLGGCWIAATASFFGQAKRRVLLDTQTGLDSLRRMSWKDFEMLAGEAFRRQGYVVTENGLGGADGGVDLILRKDGRTTLVQCKQWRSQRISVSVVREMYGVLTHERADAVKIVALGDYTLDARRFVQGKPIELIDGSALIATVHSVQRPKMQRPRFVDTPHALIGAMAVGLLVIVVLNHATRPTPSPANIYPTQAAAPAPATPPRYLPTTARVQAAPVHDYGHTPQTDAELRDWKRRNAEAMKILEKTTKEVP
ncbi:restriction endonuclease [Dyella ginsengisoli]|uniref:Restriction endonuclease n=1 Tax=Dyella ginsengisoli TaxID=363848 RepID=A0ABW8JWL5_9GAMM